MDLPRFRIEAQWFRFDPDFLTRRTTLLLHGFNHGSALLLIVLHPCYDPIDRTSLLIRCYLLYIADSTMRLHGSATVPR